MQRAVATERKQLTARKVFWRKKELVARRSGRAAPKERQAQQTAARERE